MYEKRGPRRGIFSNQGLMALNGAGCSTGQGQGVKKKRPGGFGFQEAL